jgi:hypothetical protein
MRWRIKHKSVFAKQRAFAPRTTWMPSSWGVWDARFGCCGHEPVTFFYKMVPAPEKMTMETGADQYAFAE